MKSKTVSQLKKRADAVFSKAIRLRDADPDGLVPCITCKTKKPYQQMQNGHFVKRSVSLLRYSDENCNAQCMQCNVFKYGEQFAYAKAIDEKYGPGTADSLHSQRFTTHKFTVNELESIIHDAEEAIKWYEKNR